MSSQLTQFHYELSKCPQRFDYEQESFDIKSIYMHFALKVSPA